MTCYTSQRKTVHCYTSCGAMVSLHNSIKKTTAKRVYFKFPDMKITRERIGSGGRLRQNPACVGAFCSGFSSNRRASLLGSTGKQDVRLPLFDDVVPTIVAEHVNNYSKIITTEKFGNHKM